MITYHYFKRAAYGLIDYYIEEEKELRVYAQATGMNDKVLTQRLDELWGKVTLYNCYQLFVQLTSKKKKGLLKELSEKYPKQVLESMSEDEYQEYLEELEVTKELDADLFEGKQELDMLTLYFNATRMLPKNQMRTLLGNADNSLRSMAGAEKMLSSVYGIAITAMV